MTEITEGVLARCVITRMVENQYHTPAAFPVMADNLTAAMMDEARDSITAWLPTNRHHLFNWIGLRHIVVLLRSITRMSLSVLI